MLADLDIRQLSALRAVADEGTFGRAAARLGFSQSAVSQQIASLERAVGLSLFDRPGGPRPPVLTDAGELLLGHARRLLELLDVAADELDQLRRGVTGTLRIGTFQSVSVKVLPEVVGRFRAEAPAVDVRVTELDDQVRLLKHLADGDIDVSFAVGEIDEQFSLTPLGEDPYVALLPAGAAEGPVGLHQLAGSPMVGQPAGDACQANVTAAFTRLGLQPTYVFRSSDNSAVQSMVRTGMGATIMPFLAIDPSDPSVAVREIEPPIPPRRIGLARLAHRTPSGPATRFEELTAAVCAELLRQAPST